MKNADNGNTKPGITRRGFLKAGMVVSAASGLALNLSVKSAEAAVRKLPTKWDEEVDVLIVGSGFAGLAAGAEAGARGNKVVILDKMPTYGGNSIINGGEYATWDEKLQLRQKLNLGDDSVELHAADTLKGGDYYNVPALVKTMVEGAPAALNWMIDEGGLQLRPITNRAGGHSAYRTKTCVDGVGRGYTEAIKKIAERNGVKIRLGSKVTGIWRKEAEGPVLGLEVETRKGKHNIKVTKALVLAAGGFGYDIKMRQDFNPNVTPDINCTNHKGATGEMIRYAQSIGADTLQLAFIQLYPFAEPETGILDMPAVYPFRGPGFGMVYVTKEGKRYVSELERRDVCSRAAIATKLKPTFSIFSEKMIPLMGTKEEVEIGMKKGRFLTGATIADLAANADIPPKVLEETIKKHDQYLAGGKDPEFNKPITPKMVSLTEGPYYAVAQWPAVHHTMGGLRINEKAQVLDIWGKPIPKLYAAGEIAGGVHGSNRLGSNATPDCIVFGRIAGIHAAMEKA
jgi:fumarate reductase flavoprotein subunit